MTVYQIDYDLKSPGQEYEDLYDGIEALGSSCHVLESTWFVDTDLSAKEAREELDEHVDLNDQLMVTKLQQTGSGRWSANFSNECFDWLRDHL